MNRLMKLILKKLFKVILNFIKKAL